MKNIVRFLAVVTVLALAAALHPASAKPITKSDTYVGSFDPLSFGICRSEGAPENIGKVCFKVPKKKKTALMSISDVVGDTLSPSASFFFRFLDANGRCFGQTEPTAACPNAGFGCPAKEWPIPRGAKRLEIFPLTTLGIVSCVTGGQEGLSPTTTGTVTVRFS